MSTPLLAISQDRVWQRLMELAEIGRVGETGVDRQALTHGDLLAKRWLIDWARARGFPASTDAIGNVFVRRPGLEPGSSPVVVGSHLDTEPSGGRFDGAYGVVAAMELLDALEESGTVTRRPVDLVAWNNEEGCRFQPGCMGSKTYVDPSLLPAMLASRDAAGMCVADALGEHETALPGLERRPLAQPFAAFLEAHIEQGPVLEEQNVPVAAIAGIQGRRVFQFDIVGRTGHAGTVPHALRHDALERASLILRGLYERAAGDQNIRITPGRMLVEPNSPSVVPGHVQLTVDVRHPDAAVLDHIYTWLLTLGAEGTAGVSVTLEEIDRMDPVAFDPELVDVARSASGAFGAEDRLLVSGASHDAHALAGFCPTAMVFTRCRKGVSHHPDEFAAPQDLAAGVSVLSACLLHASGATINPETIRWP